MQLTGKTPVEKTQFPCVRKASRRVYDGIGPTISHATLGKEIQRDIKKERILREHRLLEKELWSMNVYALSSYAL